ncbi:hypothetical protein EA187_07480 [Lujinxingia sediminis]|uniref:Lipoyl-binding domain-containing protein n=2 Tax=Lujinxingia sediminis TaxID=2480984 RepID=A0ABY0CVM9_9DELT|nr:hypothetical protein EA187_07480 [Lujinxingia sediminis]
MMAHYVVELDGGREHLVQLREEKRGTWKASVDRGGAREDVAVQLIGRLEGGRVVVRVNGREHILDVRGRSGAAGEVVVAGAPARAGVECVARHARVQSAGEVVLRRSGQHRSELADVPVSAPEVQRSPMTGVVLSVEVAAGQHVECGQALAVIEAMKMENTLYAAHAGVVCEVCVGPGETVRKDDVLMRWNSGAMNASEVL